MIKEIDRQYSFIELSKDIIAMKEKELNRKLTVCVNTFGCQMNAKDSEKLLGILEEIGYEAVETENADIVVYNTCTVRENANQKVYGRLGYLKTLKKKNPEMLIILCGCMMQEKEEVEKIKKSFSFVDVVFGTHNIYKLAELLYIRLTENKKVIEVLDGADKIVEELPTDRKYSFKSGVNINFGCDNFCSYCIVPYVRGRERSRKAKDILKEINKLVDDGVVEIMLLGQNVNSYGKDLENPITFAKLLEEIIKVDGIKRIRFMTSHPKDLSTDLIKVMKESEKICRHLHLPLQSGSTKILKDMNRKYSKEDYLELVKQIKEAIPNISLTTDIIVGFPGETEEDFLETLDVVEKVRYDSAYTFIYSKRSGTPAAEMLDQIEEDVIKDRFNRLIKKIQEISREETLKLEGEVLKVLVEEVNQQNPDMLTGRLDNNQMVHFKGDESLIGKIVKIKINEAKGFYFLGILEG